MKILVSACLMGTNCKYNGGNNYNAGVAEVLEGHTLLLVCPEMAGGLATPRIPAERVGDLVVNREGADVTEAFLYGAQKALELGVSEVCTLAVLKEGSPSCGSNLIYDGTFSGRKISGQGIFAQQLSHVGIQIFSENQLEALKKVLEDNENEAI